MGSGIFYSQAVKTNRNVKGGRSLRSLLLAGVLLVSLPFIGKSQPHYLAGTSVPVTVCAGAAPVDISGYLGVSDGTPGEVDTWDISSYPGIGTNGTLTGFPTYQIATGGNIYPSTSTIFYQPTPGFTGPDPVVIKVYDNNTGDTMYKTLNIVVTPLPSFTITSIPSVCAGATSASIFYSGLSQLGPTSNIFATAGATSWQVPPGVTSINYDVQGAAGGNDSHSPAGTSNPGNGARVQGTLAVSPTTTINFYVGGTGGNGTVSGATGGWNGGGNASFYFFGCGGAGGGASDIRVNGTALSNRVVVAGGGGGNGWDAPGPSCGGGGGYNGGAGCNNVGGGHAGGGSTTLNSDGAGAAYAGWSSGQNGGIPTVDHGGNGSIQGVSGGGGGGYYGGGGGVWSGGGGGSSYSDIGSTSSVTYTSNYNIGSGAISINYVIPGTYTIIWDPTAHGAGFTDIIASTFTASPITFAIPPTAAPSTYNGSLTLTNSSSMCTSNTYPISITINPIPDVVPPSSVAYCNSDNTTPILFSGSVPGTTFNWTCDQPSIGLAASGSGNIGMFSATNATTAPIIATITVTPTANGCTGAPISFTITVNPTPLLTSTLTPTAICDSTQFSYVPTSATTGTTFTWYRTTNPDISVGGSTASTSGSGNPLEYLDNTSPNAVVVPYQYVLAANGCSNTQNVNVTVYPEPSLSTSLFPGSVCSGSVFNYTPNSLTAGVSYMWNRNVVAGISNSAFAGTGNPGETLNDTTANPIPVPYVYTLTLLGTSCYNTEVVTVTVNPIPTLNTTLTPAASCNNSTFTYTPGSNTMGTIFNWVRAAMPGITSPPNFGSGAISDNLSSNSVNPVNVTYVYSLLANGCPNTQNVIETVYPTPSLSTTLSPVVCDSTVFNYPPASATTGTTFTWTRAVVAGISNLAGAGVNNPNETLVNTTPNPITVPYVFSMSANGCGPYMETVNLTVNPKPTLNSTLTPAAICDSFNFSYNPTSNTAGASFTWDRPYIPGIYAVQQTGINNPNQQLINSTYVVVNVTYTYTITANGCSNVENVVVAVNPTPKLNPPYTATVCSGSPFIYNPTSYTPGATYIWDRPLALNVAPSTSFDTIPGPGTVNEILTDQVLTPVTSIYYFRLGVNGCTNLYPQAVRLTINPTPAQAAITTYPPSTVCAGTMFQTFGTNIVAPGIEYNWTATNATVVQEGDYHQYAIVTFMTPGTSVVTLTSNVDEYGCGINSTYTVNVTGNNSETPRVVYYNGQFICLENDNDSYQWGYDDAHTLAPFVLTGEINQNYNNSNPDFTNKNYWVMTTKGGCAQKAYYNAPTGITNVNANGQTDFKVYPNPATQVLNVEISSTLGGDMQVEVMNLLGQKLDTEPVVNNKASLDVSMLPAGCYLVDCYRNGMKVATTKFVKN